MRTELAAGRFRDAKVGIEGSLPQARPELAVLGVVEGKVLLLPTVQTFIARGSNLVSAHVGPGSHAGSDTTWGVAGHVGACVGPR